MTLIVTVIGKALYAESLEGNFCKEFDGEIAEYYIVDNRILVRLKFSPKSGNQNIFCLNARADLLWQIQDPDSLRQLQTKTEAPFTKILISPQKIEAINWNSNSYELDIGTGKISNPRWTK